MSRMGAYQPIEKYKNYSFSTTKPFNSHTFYKEKEWNLQDHIYQKLNKLEKLLESLNPKLTDDFSRNAKIVIKKNLDILKNDLDLMQGGFDKNPYSFNTKKLKTNEHFIIEMKNVCDNLQKVKSYEHEFRTLSHIKHALHELDHLIQPMSLEKSFEMGEGVKIKPARVSVKKARVPVKAQKKTKEKALAIPKKKKAISKKAKPATKLLKPKKIAKQVKKSVAPVHKPKQAGKKVVKPKAKIPAKHKKIASAKPKPKIKSAAARKTKLAVKNKKV